MIDYNEEIAMLLYLIGELCIVDSLKTARIEFLLSDGCC